MSTGIGVGISSVFTSRPAGGPSIILEYSTSDYCETQVPGVVPPTVIQPAPPAGIFTSSGSGLVVNAASGVFNIGISNVGNYIITYTVAGVGSANFPINISALDNSSFSYSASSFRQNASNPAPTITGLAGGVFSGPTGIIFADSGTNTNSSSGIINLAASTVGGPYTITYTTTGNCPTSSTFDVTVQVALSITYSAASFCEDGGNTAAPTVVGDPGSGTFASTTGLTINSTTGVINTDTSTPDDNTPYTVTYTASTGETATTQVTIKALPNIIITPNPSLSVCDGSSATLTASGGDSYLWSTGATTAQITVNSSATYSVTGTGSNGCQNTASAAFTVNPLPTISISASSTSICAGDSVTLTASGAGAGGSYLWSDGQSTAVITVTPGSTITYSVIGTDTNECSNTASQQITVTPLDVATVTYSASSYCQVPTGALAVDGYYPLYANQADANAASSDGASHSHPLTGGTFYMPNSGVVIYHGTYSLTATPVITGASGTFNSPSGLSIDANGVIDKNASTAGTYSVEYTTTGSCPITVTNSITITALDNATFAYGLSAYCDNVTDPTPTKSATGTFSSSTGLSINTSTGEVDLDASTAGTYVIGFVTSGSCPNSSIQTLTINAAPTVAISGTLSYCVGSNTTLTATAGLSSYLWSSGETTQSITATAGSYTVTGTDVNGCSTTSSSVTVTETPLDNAGFSYSASSYEPTDADPTPTITGLTGGTFSGTTGLVINSTTGEIDLSASTVASHTITYDTTSSGSSVCPNTSTQTVDIALAGIANNYSMEFDRASSNYININMDLSSFSSITVSTWVKFTSTTGFQYVYSAGTGSVAGDMLGIGKWDGTTEIYSFDRANANRTGVSVTLNTWNHILVTHTGTTRKVYLNGSLIGTFTSGNLNLNSINVIGRYSFSASNYMDGFIDEVAIWDTALTSTQVSEIYNATGTNSTKDLTTVSGSNLKYWNRMGD